MVVTQWLMALFPECKDWGAGFIDKNKTHAIGVYTRPNGLMQPRSIGSLSSYGVKSISLLIRWGKSSTECEAFSMQIYQKLQNVSAYEEIGDSRCWIVASSLPVLLGRDDNGVFESVLDFNIYTREVKEYGE